jgi:predicted Zn-dependent peptidase
MDLERALDSLYGTRLGAGVQKTGDRHITWFVLNLPGDVYLPAPVLKQGIRILRATMFTPVIEHEGLNATYVEQEKQLQIGRIRSLINNKANYAVFRCIQEMYKSEPFCLHELGTEEDVRRLTPQELLKTHTYLTQTAPIAIYAVGDVKVEELQEALQGLVTGPRRPLRLEKTAVQAGAGEVRTVIDEEKMGQGWLILGFRSDITYADPARYAMQYLNGILGGFVHSKLFQNVREKASLAYNASSGYNANKGYLLALAGIDPAKYEQALEIMLKQVEDIRRGVISQGEMDSTRSRLVARTRLAQDDPMTQMMRHLAGQIEGINEYIDEVLARLNAVTIDDVVAAAARLRLDTVYFLKGVGQQPRN